MQCCSAVRATCRNYKARKTRTLNGGEGWGVWVVCSPKLPHLRKMSPADHRQTSHWNTSQGFCACLIPRRRLPLWKFPRKGRREGECGRGSASPLIFLLRKAPCASSLVIRVSRACHSRLAFAFASVRKKKSLRRRQHLVLYVGKSYIDLFLRNSREKHWVHFRNKLL